MYTKRVLKLLKQIDRKCEEYLELLILLLTVVLLRIPNFFEPYWYVDEAIYLTVGNGLKQGLRLYTDIIDHKTPLIYYLAMVPNQFYFRLLNLGWMMVTTALFFSLAKKLFVKTRIAFISTLIFVLLTTLPWLEGNIPNGELFVLGFVMAGFWLLSKTAGWQRFFYSTKLPLKKLNRQWWLLTGSGVFFGLGILTKVPALLDLGAALMIGWFVFIAKLTAKKTAWSVRLKSLLQFLAQSGWLLLGALIPIGLSIAYFVSVGSGRDYLDFGLLYNVRYSSDWQLDFTNPALQFLFTLPGKIISLGAILGLLSFTKKFTPRFQFAASWLVLSLFAALLSNRPYPHYLIQAVPAFSLLLVEFGLAIKYSPKRKTMAVIGGLLLLLPFTITGLLNVRPYSTSQYYGQFYRLLSGQISQSTYDQSFDGLVKDNYEAADLIYGLNGQRIFIWGTNPMLYALTQTTPTSRFTVSFHIKSFNDYQRTMEQIRAEKPKIIVVMNNETEELIGLSQYLDALYYANTQYPSMTLYLLRENEQAL